MKKICDVHKILSYKYIFNVIHIGFLKKIGCSKLLSLSPVKRNKVVANKNIIYMKN